MNRRRAISILGASTFAGLSSCRSRDPLHTFSTVAFGTDVHFQTHGISDSTFNNISEKCSLRLRVIESLFSLYDPESAICRLNRDGELENPHPEFLKLVRTALTFGEKTSGTFDITVQPLWNWRTKWKSADLAERVELEKTTWNETLALVDYRKVTATESVISFEKSGMAITLNAINQGYATDEIIALLKRNGVRNALVNIGEYAALGFASDGKPWSVELADTGESIDLPPSRALAVSAGSGYTFDPEGRYHHIFRPADGANTRPESSIVVTAPKATEADALSTTFAITSDSERQAILKKFPEATFLEIRP
ncbi:MAG: FAD:protein FMN transferase [Akkermansiaceae bacterium]|jgi:FAD:protein FMN transferase|nr:FAD:protein FMN transferase [Akkermansiaceae bacterium]MDP4646836.1 FAD:protein FMN transferase [Akkermansiaceae bacterium]MDP4719827.1 FAD:protein FMN transferase [Akkermansiaceae bacterium]MDP4780974.1 FAD:protein FMN transferase [Akkermansiaceae bacterium]MDP4846815.1 FAD:protein FMN transferase [Akkermansiaceae bacterium]